MTPIGLTAGDAREGHVDSYYAATANAAPARPRLEGRVDCDVCVVGGGLTGSSAALHCAEAGYDTVLVESRRMGWGASGRSGGQLLVGVSCGLPKLRRLVGPDTTKAIWDLSVEAVRLATSRIERHRIACDLKRGQMDVALKPRQVRELRERQAELERDYGHDGQRFIEPEDLRTIVASPRYIAGLYDGWSYHLHTLNYALGLAQAAADAGARLYEGSPATHVARGDRVVVRTERGEVHCRYLLLCGNAYLGRLVPEIRSRIMPVGSYIVATEPLGEARARALIANDAAVCDVNFILDYFRLSADHRLLFGGRVSYSTLEPFALKQSIRRRMVRVFPQLADARIEYAWGGFVAITMNRAPHFGRLDGNVFFAHGYSGQGIALSGLAGKLMAEAIRGTAERFDVFARIPHAPFPGGELLRMPALVAAMAWYRLRDLL
jgi:gamma-glutamylputrescine oxidase